MRLPGRTVLNGPIARATLRTSVVFGLRLLVQAGTLLLVARMLGPDQFGAFAGVTALAVILGTLSTFGTHLVFLGEVSRAPSQRMAVLCYAVPTTLLCGSVLLAIYVLVCSLVLANAGVAIHVLIAIGISETLLQPLFSLPAMEHLALGRTARSQLLTTLPLALRLVAAATVFLLAGLWGYIAARVRMRDGKPGLMRAVASIVLGTVVGGLSKESAALLPLYALIVEWIMFGFARADGKIDRRLLVIYLVILVLPACLALYWVVGHALPSAAWAGRSFTLGERLLTEPRIIWDYVQWSLLPLPNQLALYHDGIELSRGLFAPPTTALAILALASVLVAALRLRRARPLFALGIGWFFAAHLLTGTVIPLELAFEHRNYFASIGLYLALFSFLLPHAEAKLPVLRNGLCVVLIVFFAAVTWIRALNWANPLLFTLSEAQANPHSPRAAYDLANTYMVLCQQPGNSHLIPVAFEAMQHAATMPGANILPDQGLLLLSEYLHRAPPEGTWTRMQHKLATQTVSMQDTEALGKLNHCVFEGRCAFPANEMAQTFIAALQHTPPNTTVLSIYASYAYNALHDTALALDLARDAVKQSPHDMQMRRNLVLLLAASGQHEAAQAFYEQTLRELQDARQDAQLRAALDTPAAPTISTQSKSE